MSIEKTSTRIEGVRVDSRTGTYGKTMLVTQIFLSQLNREGTMRETFLMETPGAYTKAEILEMFRSISNIDETESQ